MTSTDTESPESVACTAWQQQTERHTGAEVQGAADQADLEIRTSRGVDLRDFDALGAGGRTDWYRTATRHLINACGEC